VEPLMQPCVFSACFLKLPSHAAPQFTVHGQSYFHTRLVRDPTRRRPQLVGSRNQ